jgi:hypothetical protein
MHKNDKLAKEFKEKVLNENIKDAVKKEVKAMNEIEWEEGMVCFSGGRQILFTAKADPILGDIFGLEDWIKINEDFQLNEIRQGDYIEASELDTEQKYNDAVAELELFGFTSLKSHKGYDRYTTSSLTLGDGFYCYSTNGSRKITYPQLMSIGKLKRIMIKSDKSGPNKAPDITPDVEHKKSIDYLKECMEVQKQRGEQYDSKGTGERSFDAAAKAFNAMTGRNLKGSDACLLLACVKAVRQYSDPTRVHEDSLLDLVSYASLWAEELNKELK